MACNAVLPAAAADLCDLNAAVGQIDTFYFTRDSADEDFADWTSAAEWTTNLDNTTALPAPPTRAPIRFLYVIGDNPAPDQTEIDVSLNRKFYTTPEGVINFEAEDLSAANVTLVQQAQINGGLVVRAWFKTQGGKLVGGNEGISGTLKLSILTPNSRTELQKVVGEFKYTATQADMIDSPI